MRELKKAWVCAGWNLYTLRKNPRFYLGLALGLLLTWMLTDRTLAIARTFQTNSQIMEPFVWCFADGDSMDGRHQRIRLLVLCRFQYLCIDDLARWRESVFRGACDTWGRERGQQQSKCGKDQKPSLGFHGGSFS